MFELHNVRDGRKYFCERFSFLGVVVEAWTGKYSARGGKKFSGGRRLTWCHPGWTLTRPHTYAQAQVLGAGKVDVAQTHMGLESSSVREDREDHREGRRARDKKKKHFIIFLYPQLLTPLKL